jgi:trigger factor
VLPQVRCPSLDDIAVRVAGEALTADELEDTIERWFHAQSPVEMLAPKDPIEAGDEVWVDLVAFFDGHVVPMSIRRDLCLDADSDIALPGLRAAARGRRARESFHTPVTLPEFLAPWSDVAGKTVVYAVDILRVARRSRREATDRQSLARAGLETVEQLAVVLAGQLARERLRSLEQRCRQAVVDVVMARAEDIVVPESMIDDEILAAWQLADGQALTARNFDVAEIAHVREAWRTHAPLRATVAASLRRASVLSAVASTLELPRRAEYARAWATAIGERVGVPAPEVARALAADDAKDTRLTMALAIEIAERALVERATIDVVDAAGRVERVDGREISSSPEDVVAELG